AYVTDPAENAEPVSAAVIAAVAQKFGLTPQQVEGMEADAFKALLVAHPDLTEAAVKEAEPDVTKDPEPEPKDKPVKKAKKPKKMPPWLNKPKDGDDDGDSGD